MPDRYLPDGVVKLPDEAPAGPGGCGLRGCLYGVVVLFALLLAAMVIFALVRPWPVPVMSP
jgi:hypothetical protein